jgi:hypothetical protein
LLNQRLRTLSLSSLKRLQHQHQLQHKLLPKLNHKQTQRMKRKTTMKFYTEKMKRARVIMNYHLKKIQKKKK